VVTAEVTATGHPERLSKSRLSRSIASRRLASSARAGPGVVILVALIWPLANKLFFFDWPPLYEWQQARRPLCRIDQWRVIWATGRNHPARRAEQTEAQLAYARYRQARAQRALDRRRSRLGWGVVALVGHGIGIASFAVVGQVIRNGTSAARGPGRGA
jgi:hypothetical protein